MARRTGRGCAARWRVLRIAAALTAMLLTFVGTGATSTPAFASSRWMIQPSPTPAKGGRLESVSCTATKACTAVGFSGYAGPTPLGTLAERWNGTVWTIQPTPNVTGATDSVLQAVSCATAKSCTAVGYWFTGPDTYRTLAEQWNGTAWTIQPTPTPGTGGHLDGVSCTAPKACTAVGLYGNGSISVTMAERWDGTAWAVQATPNPLGSVGNHLGGVSCLTATSCTAVGFSQNSSGIFQTLAERWNGTAWTIQPTPNPSGPQITLDAVSCLTATSCTAVGNYGDPFNAELTLAESWDGTAWTIQPTPNRLGTNGDNLSGVSCTAATVCIAVGYSRTGPPNYTYSTLAERWNGTVWAIQPTPNPSGGAIYLSGVSCTTTTGCFAAGQYFNYSNSVYETLVERYSG